MSETNDERITFAVTRTDSFPIDYLRKQLDPKVSAEFLKMLLKEEAKVNNSDIVEIDDEDNNENMEEACITHLNELVDNAIQTVYHTELRDFVCHHCNHSNAKGLFIQTYGNGGGPGGSGGYWIDESELGGEYTDGKKEFTIGCSQFYRVAGNVFTQAGDDGDEELTYVPGD